MISTSLQCKNCLQISIALSYQSRGEVFHTLWYGDVPFYRVPFSGSLPDLWVSFFSILWSFRIYGYTFEQNLQKLRIYGQLFFNFLRIYGCFIQWLDGTPPSKNGPRYPPEPQATSILFTSETPRCQGCSVHLDSFSSETSSYFIKYQLGQYIMTMCY